MMWVSLGTTGSCAASNTSFSRAAILLRSANPSKTRRNGHQQIAGRATIVLAFHPEVCHVLTDYHSYSMSGERGEYRREFIGHDVNRLQSVDNMEQTLRPVVFGDGSGLRAVCFQPGLEDFGVIVAAHGLTFVSRLLGTAFDADQKHDFIDLQHKDCVESDSLGCQFPIEVRVDCSRTRCLSRRSARGHSRRENVLQGIAGVQGSRRRHRLSDNLEIGYVNSLPNDRSRQSRTSIDFMHLSVD